MTSCFAKKSERRQMSYV
ncbi:unnamed protein product [Rhodiola kirilowii]